MAALAAIALMGSPASAQVTSTYTYDALGRLVGVSSSAGATEAYGYDAAGNRTATGMSLGNHRYWRVRSSDTTIAGDYMGIADLQLRSVTGEPDLTAGKTANASAILYQPSQAINDNTTDFWTTGANAPPSGGHWISVDLAAAVNVAEVTIRVRPDSYREDPRNLFVEWSDNNATWTTAWWVPSIAAWLAGEARTFTKPTNVVPTFFVDPSIGGSSLIGGTLTGNPGTHDGSTQAYRWLNNGVAIPGATSANYVVSAADAGDLLTFEVTATNQVGSTVAVSQAVTGGVTGHRYWRVRSSDTTIAGDYMAITEFEMRTSSGGADATTGKTAAASASYNLSGYAPSKAINDNASDFWTTGGNAPPSGGHWLSVDLASNFNVVEVTIKVRPDSYREDPRNLFVEWSNDNSAWATAWSVPTIAAWAAGEARTFTKDGNVAPAFSIQPSIGGSPATGGTLIGNPGVHDGASETYRWLNNGAAIPGATAANYLVTASDTGDALSFEVTATNANGSTVATSGAVTGGAIPHRYWRVRSSDTAIAGEYLAITELEMRMTPGGTDLTTGKTAAASAAYAGYTASKAINDNTADFWTTATAAPPSGGHWLSVDFTSATSVDVTEVTLKVRPDGYREDPLNLFVEWSDDNSAWTAAWSVPTIPTWSAGETRTFTKP